MGGPEITWQLVTAIVALAGAVSYMTRAHISDLKDQIKFFRDELTPLVKGLLETIEALGDRVENLEAENQKLRQGLRESPRDRDGGI